MLTANFVKALMNEMSEEAFVSVQILHQHFLHFHFDKVLLYFLHFFFIYYNQKLSTVCLIIHFAARIKFVKQYVLNKLVQVICKQIYGENSIRTLQQTISPFNNSTIIMNRCIYCHLLAHFRKISHVSLI